MKLNQIYSGNCIIIMEEEIAKKSIDLVYADPPYNISGKTLNLVNNTTGGPFYKMNEDWDTWEDNEYLEFTDQWISQCYRVLKDNGSMYVSCTYHNIGELIISAKKCGFRHKNIITWYKTNAMPSITKRTFTHATEFVCWFVKGKNWQFNYQELKKFNPRKAKDGKDKQMRDMIELPIVQGKERIRGENGRAMHPTQKPEKLLEMVIIASSSRGNLILDPFFGTGTTGIVASRLGRNWIGIEKKLEYVNIAEKRFLGKTNGKLKNNRSFKRERTRNSKKVTSKKC